MSSVTHRVRQNTPTHYMPVSSIAGMVYAYNSASNVSTFTNATWASTGSAYSATGSRYLSSINGAGAGLLKDLGKTILSAGRTFRKIQLVTRQVAGTSTFGVEGTALGTAPNQDFLTGYIELGFDGLGPATPVVSYGTL